LLLGLTGPPRSKRDIGPGGAFSRAFGMLRDVPGLRALIAAEASALAAPIRRWIDPGVEVVVAPYLAAYLYEAPRSESTGSNPIMGFVGKTRTERGAYLIPEIAQRTLVEHAGISWRAQLEVDRIAERFKPQAAEIVAELTATGRFDLLPPNLPTEDYHQLLRSIDVMVMPYSGRYDRTGSGVAMECLRAGCIQIVPKASSMARAAADKGAGFVTFSSPTAEAIAAAVGEALANFAELRHRSLAAVAATDADPALARISAFIGAA